MSENGIDLEYQARLAKKLSLIEELRHELGTEGIDCPGILVVGAQSAGKSSVLERLTGISFPSAENTCTRLPAIVQLHVDPIIEQNVILVSKDSNFQDATTCHNMDGLHLSILDITSKVTAEGCPIKDEPIHIKYTRKQGPIMTLIDLPGITHIDATNSEFDIHEVTANMVRKYVENDNMIVLVVIPANDDFGNAEALRIAREFDPEGIRTVGVVSKCDLVPGKSDIVDKIKMSRPSDVKLQLGFVAVKNRASDEEGLDVKEAEKILFESHPVLKHLTKEQWGCEALTKKIVNLQADRVREFFPQAKKLVRKRVSKLKNQLKELGEVIATPHQRRMLFTELVDNLCKGFRELLRAEKLTEGNINIAARTCELAEQFASRIRANLPDLLSEDFGLRISKTVDEARGYGLSNFLSDPVFRETFRLVLFTDQTQDSAQELVDETHRLVINTTKTLLSRWEKYNQYPAVVELIEAELEIFTEECMLRAKSSTEVLIESEVVQLFTQSPCYIELWNFLKRRALEKRDGEEGSQDGNEGEKQELSYSELFRDENEQNRKTTNPLLIVPTSITDKLAERMKNTQCRDEVIELQLAVYVYVQIVTQRMFDTIPMLVRKDLVYDFHRDLQMSLQAACDDNKLAESLQEKTSHRHKREELEMRIMSLQNALKTLQTASLD